MSKKISLILIILGIIFTIIGGTISYYIWSTTESERTLVTFTVNNSFSCSADGGGNIESGDVVLIPTEVNDGTTANYIKREVKVYPKTISETTIYLNLWLYINQMDIELSNSDYFRYSFTTGSTSPDDGVVTSGIFKGKSVGDKVNLLAKKYTSTLTDTYYLWIWLDAEETNIDVLSKSFSLSLGGSCADGEYGSGVLIANANPTTLTYTDATDSQKKEMWTFSHDATEQVPATIDYRYIGGEYCSYESGQYKYPVSSDGTCPKRYNYVRTTISSGSTYTATNQSSCPSDNSSYTYECTELTLDGIFGVEPNNYITYNDEVWRIIGVFDGRIKIVRDESIGGMAWDAKQNGVGSSKSDEYGSNDWTDSQLMYMLNPTSYTLKTGYSLNNNMIYDANGNIIYQFGCQPAGIASGATSYECVENTWGLNETALSQIEATDFYLGVKSLEINYSSMPSVFLGTPADVYSWERGTPKYSDRDEKWSGLVGLVYYSDVFYSITDFENNSCYSDVMYCSVDELSNSWLYSGEFYWTITQLYYSINENSSTNLGYFDAVMYMDELVIPAAGGYVRPVVYLRSNVMLSGTGEKTNPYTISF